MPCEAFRDLLHAYIDGELDRSTAAKVAHHLAGCPRCAQSCEEMKGLGGTLRSLLPAVAPPPGLHESIRAALRRVEMPPVPPALGGHSLFLVVLLAGAAVAAGAGVGLKFVIRPTPALTERPVAEVTSCHIRSLMGDHLLDVKNADPAALRNWFQARLSFVPLIADPPPAANFALAGGRLDWVDGHPAASVVYRQAGHIVNLVVYPDPRGPEALPPGLVFLESGGYQLAHWGKGGMIYWVITDLNAKELLGLLHHLGQATPPHCHW
jgi:anti-sigma factor RsiW